MSTWDVFISHASQDKASFAQPLAEALRLCGLNVWFDSFTLRVGDSLRQAIDAGLSQSRYGVVVISPAFLRKEWPQKELNGLVAREIRGEKLILPVWHDVDLETIRQYSPILSDRVATSSKRGLECVVADLLSAMRLDLPEKTIGSIEVLDKIDKHILYMLHTAFGLKGFQFVQVAERMNISERFHYRFDGLLHRGYIDKFLDESTKSIMYRLSPSLDTGKIQKQALEPRNGNEA